MKTKIYSVDSVEEALSLASKEFNISEEELIEKIIKEKDDEDNKMEVEITVCIDPIEKGKRYINQILIDNGVEGRIEKRVRDNVVELSVDADEFNGVLIGRNSRHLNALQTLVSAIINKYYEDDEQIVVKVDVGGYRHRHEATLERMAIEYGKQVAKTKQTIKLDNLNSYERKIIHDKLSTWKDVTTHSEGENPNRVLFIEPKN
jgi:spoIIIJ-associated protein